MARPPPPHGDRVRVGGRWQGVTPLPWGFTPVDDTRACFGRCKDGRRTCEVGKLPAGATPEGVLDLAGNVWEWTSSPACPLRQPRVRERAAHHPRRRLLPAPIRSSCARTPASHVTRATARARSASAARAHDVARPRAVLPASHGAVRVSADVRAHPDPEVTARRHGEAREEEPRLIRPFLSSSGPALRAMRDGSTPLPQLVDARATPATLRRCASCSCAARSFPPVVAGWRRTPDADWPASGLLGATSVSTLRLPPPNSTYIRVQPAEPTAIVDPASGKPAVIDFEVREDPGNVLVSSHTCSRSTTRSSGASAGRGSPPPSCVPTRLVGPRSMSAMEPLARAAVGARRGRLRGSHQSQSDPARHARPRDRLWAPEAAAGRQVGLRRPQRRRLRPHAGRWPADGP